MFFALFVGLGKYLVENQQMNFSIFIRHHHRSFATLYLAFDDGIPLPSLEVAAIRLNMTKTGVETFGRIKLTQDGFAEFWYIAFVLLITSDTLLGTHHCLWDGSFLVFPWICIFYLFDSYATLFSAQEIKHL